MIDLITHSASVLNNEYVEVFWWPLTDFLWVKTWNRTVETPMANARHKLEVIFTVRKSAILLINIDSKPISAIILCVSIA